MMRLIFFSSAIVLSIGYAIFILVLYRGLAKLQTGTNRQRYRISVVIAARNEAQHIGHCLKALLAQTYPSDLFEIIVVDDRSTDGTAAILDDYQAQSPRLRMIRVTSVPAGISPKKNALAQGIQAACGEIIVTTDADCQPHPQWLESLIPFFEPDVGLVAGFSPLEINRNSLIQKLFVLDSLSLAGLAAGSFGWGKPLTCNGRNLAYRRETFQEVDGFKQIQHFVSGDDDLLLHLIRQKTRWQTRYALSKTAIVRSQAPEGWQQFFQQRIRHASKGRYYPGWLKLILIAIYLVNLSLVSLLVMALFVPNALAMWLGCLLIKSSAEYLLVGKMANYFGYRDVLAAFPVAMGLHPFYVTVFGLWGQLGRFRWKGTSFQATSA